MVYNGAKLRGKIVEKYGSRARFARAMDMSAAAVTQKITGKRAWKSNEMLRGCILLGLSLTEMADYFCPESSSI